MKYPPPPTVHDYPRAFINDGRPGAERRQTIDRVALSDAANDAAEPLVSIITVVFDNHRHIERAMKSVFEQSYRNIEYIVIDGGSTDGTVDLIRCHAQRLSYWHSARDRGISDAFNAGVALARGQFVGLVNSDDWMSTNQVEEGVKALIRSDAPFVFGDLNYYSPDGNIQYRILGDASYATKLWHRMPHVTHPTALVNRKVYEQFGLFNCRWKIGMDYDWLLRLNHRGLRGTHVHLIVGNMTLGGVSNRHWRKCLKEHYEIAIEHGTPWVIASTLLGLRVIKITIRITMERFLSRRIGLLLRRLINRNIIYQNNG